jgi:hypothetical protein
VLALCLEPASRKLLGFETSLSATQHHPASSKKYWGSFDQRDLVIRGIWLWHDSSALCNAVSRHVWDKFSTGITAYSFWHNLRKKLSWVKRLCSWPQTQFVIWRTLFDLAAGYVLGMPMNLSLLQARVVVLAWHTIIVGVVGVCSKPGKCEFRSAGFPRHRKRTISFHSLINGQTLPFNTFEMFK